jgi:hypothetical protein
MSSPLPFSAGSQLALGGEYDEGVAVNPKMSPRSPVVDCETGAAAAAAVAPVAPTSPPSCTKICSPFQIQDEITHSLYSSVRFVTQYG